MLEAAHHLGIAYATGETINPELAALTPWRRKARVDR
jgi:hypothetical protein